MAQKRRLSDFYRPGQKCPRSGQWEVWDAEGGTEIEITLSKGERFPPQRRKGCRYRLNDPTAHQNPT